MPVDSSTIDGLLKKVYTPKEIENLQNMETATLSKIKKSPKKPAGQGFVFPVNLKKKKKGQGSQNELEALRTSGSQTPVQGTILPKVFTHTIRYSGLSLAIAKGNEESFADNATFQVEEGFKDSSKELNAQLFRDGSGLLALVNGAVSASATVTFDNGVPTHFREGMELDFFNGATKEVSAAEVSSINISSSQIVLSSAVTLTDNDEIYRAGVNDNAPTDGKEWAGLPLVTDDGSLLTTYEGISRSTYPKWDGISIAQSGANISNDKLQQAISRVKVTSGKKPKKIISNTSQFRKYLDVVTPMKTFNDSNKMDSGYVAVPTWNGMEWIEDTDCAFDTIYMIDPDYFELFEVTPLQLSEEDGKVFKWDNGYDAYVSYIKSYANSGSTCPNAHVAITGLATPTF